MSRRGVALGLALLVVAGCSSSGGRKNAHQASPTSSATTTAPTDTSFPDEGVSTTTNIPTGHHQVGEAITLEGADSGQEVLRVVVDKVETIRGEEFNKPERGFFLGVHVRVKALADEQTSLYGDFYVLMRGHHYDGDAYAERWTPSLDYVDLNQGETAEGWLIFDVPARHGQVVLGQTGGSGGGKIATWSF